MAGGRYVNERVAHVKIDCDSRRCRPGLGMKGFLQSGALRDADKPIWYDVWRAFPPKVPPNLSRPLPKVTVKEIFYPEDYVRAKYNKTYLRSVASMDLEKPFKEMKSEVFVKEYIKQQKPGQTVDHVIESTVSELQQRDLHLAKIGEKPLSSTESKVDFPVKRPEAPSRQAEVDFLDLFMDDDDDDGGGDGEDSTPGDGK